MEKLSAPVDFVQNQLSFIRTAPIDWKGIIIAFTWLITGFESYLM